MLRRGSLFATAAIFIVTLGFTMLYIYYEFVDPFAYSTATLTQFYLISHRVVIEPFSTPGFYKDNVNWLSYRPASSLIFMTLSETAGVSPEALIYVPIPGVVNILVFFLVGRLLLSEKGGRESNRLSSLLILFLISIGIVINTGPAVVATNYYISLGYMFIFLYTYLLLRVMKSEDFDNGVLALLVIISLVSVITYYTSSFIIIALNFILLIILLMNREKSSMPKKVQVVVYNLLIISLIAYSQEKTSYEYLAKAISRGSETIEHFRTGVTGLIDAFLSLTLGRRAYASYKLTFRHYITLSNILGRAYLVAIASLALIAIAVIVWILLSRGRIAGLTKIEKLSLVSVFFIALSQIVVYFIFGEYNYSLTWVFLGLVVLIFIRRITLLNTSKGRMLSYLAAALLVLAVLSGYGKQFIYISDNVFTNYYSLNKPAVRYYLDYIVPERSIVLVNHKLYALSIYESVRRGNYDNISFAFLNMETRIDRYHEVYYVESPNVPYIYLGVKGVESKKIVFEKVFGSANLVSVAWGVIYNSGTTYIWKIN